jgi:hypothetical protein
MTSMTVYLIFEPDELQVWPAHPDLCIVGLLGLKEFSDRAAGSSSVTTVTQCVHLSHYCHTVSRVEQP